MEKCYIPMERRRSSEVKFHSDVAPGIRFLAIDRSLYKDAPVYVAVRCVKDVTNEQPEYVGLHTHSVDSIYLFVGSGEALEGLQATVRIQDEERQIESPMSVLIPRGIPHSYRLTRGSGIYVSILLDGDYNGSTF
jgi:mannose-6-phosphate isomerase-like protein (cupin superfamily)